MNTRYDKIIIGAGIYGLYSAVYSSNKGEKVLVIEYDDTSFSRATYINQARVHNGYHYPRSYSTAIKSAKYFDRFNNDYDFAVNNTFEKIYATSSEYSWTNAEQFQKFSDAANVRCEKINSEKYFKKSMCDGVFETEEYAFDAMLIKEYYDSLIDKDPNIDIIFNARIECIKKDDENKLYNVHLNNGGVFVRIFY